MKKLHEITDAISVLGGEFNARTESHPRMATWKVTHKYWSNNEKSRMYLNLVADEKSFPIGHIDMNTMTFIYAPAGSYYKEPMALAKKAIEAILA